MKVIGITGPTGAGKTTALNALAELGGTIIDADAVYHDLTRTCRPMLAELRDRFPTVFEGERINLKKLGEIVFRIQEEMDDLNAIKPIIAGPGWDMVVAAVASARRCDPREVPLDLVKERLRGIGHIVP